ncbi:MAG: hypothetical protein M3176_00085 [Chloroflexota bacterium]|nr:hypothetical protein [Chloroflexota bacterium]
MQQVKRAVPFFKPLLKLLRVDVAAMEVALAGTDDLAERARALATLPDRFNRIFAERGWIVYDALNLDAAFAAVEKAEAGDVDGAEADLVTYYDEATINFNLMMFNGVRAFRSRLPLARKALADYVAGRYHACVPVVLALLDGMVNELGGHGFFAQGVDLQAWDSVAGHSKGLAALAKILGASRTKTTTEPMAIPCRNGILHGMDLGYDNQMVAAKAWAALFAARDWAVKKERKETEVPEPPPRASLRELFGQIVDNEDSKKRLAAWQPRGLVPGRDIPASGPPDVYGAGTPERKLAEFLSFWRNRNYGHMAQCAAHFHTDNPKKLPHDLRAHYDEARLTDYQIAAVNEQGSGLVFITTRLVIAQGAEEVVWERRFGLVNEDAHGNPAPRDKPGSGWTISTPFV